jgi:hypothetical protein
MAIGIHDLGNYFKKIGLTHSIEERNLLTTSHVMNREY